MERKRTNTEKLVITAILIALEVILTRFVGISTPMLRISFGFLPMVIVAMYYGPIWGGGAYALADVLGSLIFPTGAYFPGFTVSACLTGIIYGLFLHKRKVTGNRPRSRHRSGIGHQSSGEHLLAHHYSGQRLHGNAAGQIRQRAPLRANRHRTDSRAEQSNPANSPTGSLRGI